MSTDLAKDLDHQRQARRYVTKALALAAAEGYTQTVVTAHKIALPLVLFVLREGIEPRFVSRVLARMGPESLAGVVEIAQDADPAVRERAVNALEVIGTQNTTSDQDSYLKTILATLDQLTQDPDPKVRAAAAQAQRAISR